MERPKNTYRQDKKKTQLRVSGGGMESVIVWGGALAIAGLIAAFTIKKSSRRRDDNGGNKKQDERNQGLRSILQPTVHHNQCCASYGSSKLGVGSSKLGVIQNGSSELVSNQSLILEEESVPIIYGGNEDSTNGYLILPSDYSEEEASFDEVYSEEEIIASSNEVPVDRSSYKPGNMIKNGHGELMATIGAYGKNEADDPEQMAVEQTSQMKLAEEEDEEEEEEEEGDDDDDEGETEDEDDVDEEDRNKEKGEESSEGKGSSSMESNVEAIWPAEIIEALSPESKEVNNLQNSGKKIAGHLVNNNSGNILGEDSDNYKTTENSTMVLNKKENQELVTVNEQTARPPKWKIWIWPLLVLVLLLLLVLTYTS